MDISKVTKNKNEEDSYVVKLPIFEGPFDLLFHLINKEELNIWEIPLAKITEEYLRYLHSLRELKVEPAGEFLVMAASLLYLKSKLLLPQQSSYSPEEEAEALFFGSKEELVRSLLEYKRIKLIAAKLKEREEQQVRIFLRSAALPRVVIVNRQFSLYPHDPDILKDAWQQIKKRNVIKAKTVSLPEEIPFSRKLQDIISRIKQKGAVNYYLDDFLEKKEKKEIVLTFFVLLELAKRGKISLQQRRIFGKISVLRPIIRK